MVDQRRREQWADRLIEGDDAPFVLPRLDTSQ